MSVWQWAREAFTGSVLVGAIGTLLSVPSPQTYSAALALACVLVVWIAKLWMHRDRMQADEELTQGQQLARLQKRSERLLLAVIRSLRIINFLMGVAAGKCTLGASELSELQIDIAEVEAVLDSPTPRDGISIRSSPRVAVAEDDEG